MKHKKYIISSLSSLLPNSGCTFFRGSYLSGALTTLEGPTLGAPSLEPLLLGVLPEYTASKGAKGALPLRVPTLVPPLPPLEELTYGVPPFEGSYLSAAPPTAPREQFFCRFFLTSRMAM